MWPTRGCVCPHCWSAISLIVDPCCRRCGLTLPREHAACRQCDERWQVLDATRAVGEYAGTLRRIIHALKYGRRTSLATPLGDAMRLVGADILASADCVVPVPLHRWRALRRSFNQARLLSDRLDRPVIEALTRTRATARQSQLTRQGRWRNAQASIAVRARSAHRIHGRSVVLVDDVVTTGATVMACATALKAAGAARVSVLAVARSVRRRLR